MKDIPIIFSAPMVRALLDGRKTMTRRLAWRDSKPRLDRGVKYTHTSASPWQKVKPGDRLWVRENTRLASLGPGQAVGISYAADGAMPSVHFFEVDQHKLKRASVTPCIHMPRWASRLTLVVTAVKIEHIQSMSDADAIAEGVEAYRQSWSKKEAGLAFLRGTEAATETGNGTVAQRLFYLLWTSLHGNNGWKSNSEVVAITFTVHKQNIDALPKTEAA